MRRNIKTWIATILLASITFMVVPPEFVHYYFHDHSETDDHIFDAHKTAFENEHDHCLLLKIELPLYVVNSYGWDQSKTLYCEKPVVFYLHSIFLTDRNNLDLRGPPVIS